MLKPFILFVATFQMMLITASVFAGNVQLQKVESTKMETKKIYGQVLTKADYEEMRKNQNPNWVPGEAGIKQRIARFKKEIDSFSSGESADIRFAPARMAELAKQSGHFHLERGDLVLTFAPGSIPAGASFTMKSVSLVSKAKEKFDSKDPIEGETASVSGSKNGKSFSAQVIKFGLPIGADDVDTAEGSAAIEIVVNSEYDTFVVSKSHPKANGFELIEIKPDFVRLKFHGIDGYAFSADAHASGKQIVSWPVSGGLDEAFHAYLKTTPWQDIPGEVASPSDGVIVVATKSQADEIRLSKFKGSKKYPVTSTWVADR